VQKTYTRAEHPTRSRTMKESTKVYKGRDIEKALTEIHSKSDLRKQSYDLILSDQKRWK
jgi:hypothetical protein